jgi:hypothetical protein
LTVKLSLIFRKRFTVLKTVNRFSKLNSSSLQARFISDCRNQKMVGRRNPGGTEIRRHPATVAGCRRTRFRPNLAGIRPWLEASRNPAGPDWIQPDLDGSGRIWPKWPGSGGARPTSATFGRIRPNVLAGIRQRQPNVAGFR